MNYLESAIQFATIMHGGQLDKCGEPYILHPLRVMMTLQGNIYRTVAILHDVLEDTLATVSSLQEMFPENIIDGVVAITKVKGESYDQYLKRVCDNPIARVVKIADVKDNASPSRLYRLDPETIQRLTKKYSYALKVLEGW